MQLIKAEQRGHRVLTLWEDGVADEFPTIWLLLGHQESVVLWVHI